MVLPGGILRCRALGIPLLCCALRPRGPRLPCPCPPGQRGVHEEGEILARHCRGLQTG